MNALLKLSLLVVLVFAGGCGSKSEPGQEISETPSNSVPAEATPDKNTEEPNTDDDSTTESSDPPKKPEKEVPQIFSARQIYLDVQSGKREAKLFSIVEDSAPVGVSGVIAEIDAYDTDLFEETPKPTIKLETGIPEPNFGGYKESLVDCEFSDPAQLKDLKIGQTVSISGQIKWKFAFGNKNAFGMEQCTIIKTEPIGIAAAPFYTSEQSTKDFGDEGPKLAELTKALDNANIGYLNMSISQNMTHDIDFYQRIAGPDGHLPQSAIDALNMVPVIEELEADPFIGITDAIAEDLSKVRYAQELEIGAQKLSRTGLESLLKIPGVFDLRLKEPMALQGGDFEVLKSVPWLRKLNVSGPYNGLALRGTGDALLGHLAHTPELRELDFSRLDISDAGLTALKQLPYLRTIKMIKCPINGSGLANLPQDNLLFSLVLEGETIDDQLASAFPKLGNLVALSMSKVNVTSAFAEPFSGIPKLKSLGLHDAPEVDNSIADHLAKLPDLEILTLSRTGIGEGFRLPDGKFAKLRRIHLRESSLSDEDFASLGKLPALENLMFADPTLTDAGVSAFVESVNATESKIREISLTKTSITEASILSLLEIPSIRYITVNNELQVSDATMSKLTEGDRDVKLKRSSY